MEIDGKDLAGKNNQEVSEMLRGQVGTSFKLKVQRPGTEKPLGFRHCAPFHPIAVHTLLYGAG